MVLNPLCILKAESLKKDQCGNVKMEALPISLTGEIMANKTALTSNDVSARRL